MEKGDYSRGRQILEKPAAKGEALAITFLGMMHQHGWGVPVDYDRAMDFYQAAARRGDLTAVNQIGFMVLHGLGRTADPKQAWCWFERAAEGGFEQSARHLAELMAAGMQPAGCKPSGAQVSDAADRRQNQGGVSGKALQLWNGVREGMTPDQVASALPAPFRGAFPPGRQGSPLSPLLSTRARAGISDVVVAPAVLLGQPAIANVAFVDHAAQTVVLNIHPQSDDPDQNLNLARALARQFDAAYGHSVQLTDQHGGVTGAWRRGDLAVQLDYTPMADQPPGFSVLFMRDEPNRGALPFSMNAILTLAGHAATPNVGFPAR